ncbi:MAG: 2-C-methyl-D-erythritol 2,4-cyclodiphosphate synthase [Candidatus Enterosoma sp.]|nr:2-C-methyl-D-erythritol 2,4-cyclodiphosphate synthase [Bacilli bacterium]MDD7607531.1 2-C-methyl-D-erythritol 2,4-cyclodiphosphate synthase [bacterium]MDY3907919.1 2-C-methyl-D-erythritol 2,4-cyclodiphosphate synthase [Candidatus Enterosoma sp.]MDY5650408.1 2-C-methyl-D-erythritol 2,4-cyclodiphosphate synthase [Candidatus Enterosoma sp.]MDY5865699.1 2-C-methyl-D-erythritol 2,4-cyclodiphosphate synthase [Candidatus Enterosoma sp.]
MNDFLVGFGYDIHRLCRGEYILLAGIKVKAEKRIIAHSDGDIVFHSLSQAILSALGKEDIGTYFPDYEKKTLNMDSSMIVSLAVKMMSEEGYRVNNVVIDIVLQSPKLKDYKEKIKEKISSVLSVDKKRVAINANTHERVDSVGKEKAIEVYSVVSLVK